MVCVIILYTNVNDDYLPYILHNDYWPILTEEEQLQIAKCFVGSEIRRAIFYMETFKVLCPDGYQRQRNWDLMGCQLMYMAPSVL